MIIVDLLIICIMVGLAVYSIENRRMNVENEEQINRLNKIVVIDQKHTELEIKDIKRIYVVQAVKLRNLEEKDTLLAQQK